MSAVNVLIIDDNPTNNESFAHFLCDDASDSYVVRCAVSATEGLESLQDFEVDVLLLADDLPEMTCEAFVGRLLEQYGQLPLATVLMTTNDLKDLAVQAINMGMVDCVMKEHITRERLPEIIQDSLTRFQEIMQSRIPQVQIINLLHAPESENIVSALDKSSVLRVSHPASKTDVDALAVEDDETTLILTDYFLADGREAVPTLRRKFEHLPIVVISSNHGEQQVVDAIKAGADDYIAQDSERISHLSEILLVQVANYRVNQSKMQSVQELQSQRELLQMFVEHTPAAVAMFDTKMRYMIASHRWYEDYQIVDEDIIGKSHYDVFPEIGDDWKQIHQACLTGGVHQASTETFKRDDGRVEYLKWDVRPWYKAPDSIGGIVMFTEIITDEVRTRYQLAQSELQYRQLVSNLPDTAVIMFDHEMRYTLAIGAFLDSVGYAPEKILGHTPEEVLPEASLKALIPAYERVLAGEEFGLVREVEINDVPYVYDSQFVPVYDFDELVVRGMIVIRDITQQYMSEKKLRESERRFKGIFNQTFNFIGLTTPDGTLLEANDTALIFGGMQIEDIVNKPFWDARWWSFSEESQERLKGWIVRAAQGEFIREEVVVQAGDGSFITIDFSLKPLVNDDGDVIMLIPEGHDISERIRMEQELNEKYAELDRFFTVGIDLLCIAHVEGYFIRVNQAFERILGYTPEELEGRNFAELIHPDDIESTNAALVELDEQNPIWSFTNRYRTKAGEYRYIEWRSQPHGQYIYAAARDITERIISERELRQAMKNLQAANEEIQQFAHIVSHDLRSPLINLKGFTAIIERALNDFAQIEADILPLLTPDQQTVVQKVSGERTQIAIKFINNAVDKMDNYTSAILKLARIGRRQFTYSEVEVASIVQSVVDTLATTIEEQAIEVVIEPLPSVMGDKLALDQIFTNLITNAVKYLDKERAGRIVIRGREEADSVVFEVEDNGLGIADSDYSKVFAPFRRIGLPEADGEGMGLAYVQALVRSQGGDIGFTSTVDVGSTFSFTIPKSGGIK